jgi:hypothetical protein
MIGFKDYTSKSIGQFPNGFGLALQGIKHRGLRLYKAIHWIVVQWITFGIPSSEYKVVFDGG